MRNAIKISASWRLPLNWRLLFQIDFEGDKIGIMWVNRCIQKRLSDRLTSVMRIPLSVRRHHLGIFTQKIVELSCCIVVE